MKFVKAWVNTPRQDGGLGKMEIPVLSDFSKQIAANFGVLEKETGLSYRFEKVKFFIIFCLAVCS